ncbi:MAG: hypothetical protein E5Y89_05050 [Mesorhizobium sp.]|nr:MAG: hypothetical protein E5Y89_05050 [Mesorhizobium sp.]
MQDGDWQARLEKSRALGSARQRQLRAQNRRASARNEASENVMRKSKIYDRTHQFGSDAGGSRNRPLDGRFELL